MSNEKSRIAYNRTPGSQPSRSHHTHRRTLLRWIQLLGIHTGTRTNPSKSGCLRRGSAHLPDQSRRQAAPHPHRTVLDPETDTFCQTHADVTGCVVEAHDALLYQVFQPTNPPERPTDPPISSKTKGVRETAADLTGLAIMIVVSWAAFMVL